MTDIPHEPGPDNSLTLLREGYTFISRRCERYNTDIFSTRLMLDTAYCVMGEDAARMFYEPGRFTRQKAMPSTTLRLLQDHGSVQTLDGEAHRHRKQMFMDLMTTPQMQCLTEAAEQQWRQAIKYWQNEDEVVLLDAVREVLCRTACDWADVPLTDVQARERTREFGAMIDGTGSVGPLAARGLWLRRRTERWAQEIIQQIRDGELQPSAGRPAEAIAHHRDAEGRLLSREVAAVELINILRPIVAISRFIAYSALALHEYPEAREQVQAGGEDARHQFAQEVRRFYPYFPCIGGRVLEPFDWRGHHFKSGDWVLLDIYGTNHDRRIWDEPQAFRPQRFANREGNAYDLIPQGGGDAHRGHRCPADEVSVVLIGVALRMLTSEMEYDVPQQNLHVSLSDLPAAPQDRFRIRHVVACRPNQSG